MFLKKNKKAKKETINIKKEEKAEKVTYHKSITNKQDKKKKMIVEVPTTTSELMKLFYLKIIMILTIFLELVMMDIIQLV